MIREIAYSANRQPRRPGRPRSACSDRCTAGGGAAAADAGGMEGILILNVPGQSRASLLVDHISGTNRLYWILDFPDFEFPGLRASRI